MPMTAIIRFGYVTLGTVSLMLGVVGVLLPVFPGTGFLVLAAWAFARSAPSVHRWLRANPWIGPPVRRWESERCLDLRIKRLASAMLGTSALVSAPALWDRPVLLAATLAAQVAVLFYLHTRATCPAPS